jgi:endo-1,4-beta-xylanase
MKTYIHHLSSRFALLAFVCSAGTAAAQTAEPSATLKDAYKDKFLMGAAINRTIATGRASGRGNRTQEQVEQDVALTVKHFNQVSPENDLKWQLIHPTAGSDGYNWEPADAFVEFGTKHKMYLVGHTLIWHNQTPNWVFQGNAPPVAEGTTPPNTEARQQERGAADRGAAEGEAARRGRGRRGGGRGRGITGPLATREELLERMRNHIHAVVGRYKGKIKAWDVVNEALADGEGEEVLRNSYWRQIIGDDFIAKAFQFAHEADPDCILRYNDYGLEGAVKRRRLIKLITQLKEQGVPVHAIGTQAHLNLSNASFERMDEALTEMATLGLPIHVTELDINTARGGQRNPGGDIAGAAAAAQGGAVDDASERLAKAYEGTFRAFAKHRNHVKLVTFWGANDAVSWLRGGRPLLFDGDNQPKPAFDAVIRVATER